MTLGNPIIDATMLRLVTHIYDSTRTHGDQDSSDSSN